jgi:hypothetical protein
MGQCCYSNTMDRTQYETGWQFSTTAGYVLLACTLYNTTSGVSGDGTLATIQFNVRGNGRRSLDLCDTMLLDSSEQQITHTVTDGDFRTSAL